MKSDAKKNVVVDTGLIIEYLTINPQVKEQKENKKYLDEILFKNKRISQIYISLLTKVELLYIVCSSFDWSRAKEIVDQIVGNFIILRNEDIENLAALIKCKFPLALPDCFNLSLAVLYNMPVYFMEEKEFTKEIVKQIQTELKIKINLIEKRR